MTAIELRGIHKSFGKTPVITGVDLAIARGERHAIIGPNGAGKSTLFNLVSGRYPVTRGTIHLNGEDVTGLPPFRINRKGLARSFQVTNIFHRLSVFENLRCAVLWSLSYRYSFWHRLSGLADARERAERVMEEIGLASRREHARRRAVVRRAARARDRRHDRGRGATSSCSTSQLPG